MLLWILPFGETHKVQIYTQKYKYHTLSFELENKIVPEPINARPFTRPECPPKIPPGLSIPVLGSQSLMVLSSDPLTRRVESGLKHSAVTTSAWAFFSRCFLLTLVQDWGIGSEGLRMSFHTKRMPIGM